MAEENKELDRLVAGLALPAGPAVAKQACLCDKLVDVVERSRLWHSGVVNYNECLCPDCRKEFEQHARIVCLGCKTLQMFIQPQRVKTGFVFKAQTHYHVEHCPSCRPGAVAAPVLEHLRFCREQGQPTNVDADIVQEAERKALQGDAAAAKMRAVLQQPIPTS